MVRRYKDILINYYLVMKKTKFSSLSGLKINNDLFYILLGLHYLCAEN